MPLIIVSGGSLSVLRAYVLTLDNILLLISNLHAFLVPIVVLVCKYIPISPWVHVNGPYPVVLLFYRLLQEMATPTPGITGSDYLQSVLFYQLVLTISLALGAIVISGHSVERYMA